MHNTARTLRQILDVLVNLLLDALSSQSYDKRQVWAPGQSLDSEFR